MGVLDFVYKLSPVFMQNFLCTAYGYIENKKRYGKHFRDFLFFLRASDYWDHRQRESYQAQALTNLLLGLKRNNYYGVALSKFSSQDIVVNPFAVLAGLPLTEKKDVFQFFNDIRVSAAGGFEVKTSGTTGTSLRIYKTNEDMSAQTACWVRHRERFNVSFRDLSVNFTGKLVVPSRTSKPPFWRYNAAWKQYLVNMQHITRDNINEIVGFLNSIAPVFYSGYPSIIANVASLALEQGLELHASARPKVVFCGAENTLAWQSEAIFRWTGATITDLYGLTEGACNLSKCQHGYYHEDFEICYTELAEPENLADGRIRGKLVGTGFALKAFPLLRYNTGDVAVRMPSSFLCGCGRRGTVYESIEGRVDDYVLTPGGSKVMRFDYLFKDTREIEEVQVVQPLVDSVTFRIKLRKNAEIGLLEDLLTRRFAEWISADMKLNFEYVEDIEKTSAGKFKAVVSLLR
ncbi:hypothetical protein [Stutzerimonas nitrititolerans]|uniref:hypothetical protein n=1 Tax=Stutzerimonas nitrititolerans TaxID=2482751 RepID=UPI0028ADFFE9|nr:hypothetical protein [Stutzerimonas nitrititolerans]